jgi:Cation efflux family
MYARYRCASRRAYFSSLRSARRKNERERDLENYLEQTARLQVILHLGRICRADRRRSCSCQQSWAAIWTGSAAMMSEAIHSIVDTTKRNLICSTESIAPGGKPTEITHLVMEGKCIFWSFVVSLLIFAFGAGFSIYEGVHRIRYPAPIQAPIVSCVVLALAFLLKAARGCIH